MQHGIFLTKEYKIITKKCSDNEHHWTKVKWKLISLLAEENHRRWGTSISIDILWAF